MTTRALLLPILLAAAGAPAAERPDRAEDHAQVELLSDTGAVVPGRPFSAGLHFRLEPGWHVYWKNPGDSGMPPQVSWRLPDRFESGAIAWPAPERIAVGPLVSFGYSGEVLLPVELRPPPELPDGPVTVAAQVDYLVCKVDCLPGRAEPSLTLPVAGAPAAPAPAVEALFDRARARLPRPLDGSGFGAAAARGRDEIWFRLEPPAGLRPESVLFFPEGQGLIDNAAEQEVTSAAGALLVRVPRPAAGGLPLPERIGGLFVVGTAGGPEVALEADLPLGEEAAWLPGAAGGIGLLLALAAAFAGGLLLNLMPCVLPILSLKLLALAGEARAPGRRAIRNAAAFAAGVLASFWLLAALLVGLRAAGAQLGWGFQLQSPGVVIFLAGLFLLLALVFFGVVEAGGRLAGLAGGLERRAAGGGGLAGAFASGVLATVVATPCTAPFMGTALGYALTRPPAAAFAVFTALGAGMALPYVALAGSVRLRRRLPRPGPWMVTLRQALGFPLLGTVIWLAWVFARLEGGDAGAAGARGVIWLLTGLLLLSAGAWALGQLGAGALRRRPFAAALALLLLGFGWVLPLRAVGGGEGPIAWEPFDPARIAALEREGRPYLVDFTASWCLTCQVNEAVALDRPAVARALAARGVVPIRADWTNRDTAIARALERYGRAGVPLVVIEPGGGAEPVLLPSLLTEGIVLEALRRLPEP